MEKIKSFFVSDRGKDILTVIIIILVGLASFGLGRLSKNAQNAGIKVEYAGGVEKDVKDVLGPKSAVLGAEDTLAVKTFFASNRGSKYYSIGCPGGKTIKEENKIYFSTKEEAERAGYELSASCR
ncbi:MAG: hypothetical protein AAB943_00870 [Patescibacteria group bacterium]